MTTGRKDEKKDRALKTQLWFRLSVLHGNVVVLIRDPYKK